MDETMAQAAEIRRLKTKCNALIADRSHLKTLKAAYERLTKLYNSVIDENGDKELENIRLFSERQTLKAELATEREQLTKFINIQLDAHGIECLPSPPKSTIVLCKCGQEYDTSTCWTPETCPSCLHIPTVEFNPDTPFAMFNAEGKAPAEEFERTEALVHRIEQLERRSNRHRG